MRPQHDNEPSLISERHAAAREQTKGSSGTPTHERDENAFRAGSHDAMRVGPISEAVGAMSTYGGGRHDGGFPRPANRPWKRRRKHLRDCTSELHGDEHTIVDVCCALPAAINCKRERSVGENDAHEHFHRGVAGRESETQRAGQPAIDRSRRLQESGIDSGNRNTKCAEAACARDVANRREIG